MATVSSRLASFKETFLREVIAFSLLVVVLLENCEGEVSGDAAKRRTSCWQRRRYS
jgi:hypothetical protein